MKENVIFSRCGHELERVIADMACPVCARKEIERLREAERKWMFSSMKPDLYEAEIGRLRAAIERLQSREFEALGWMYAELCSRVDAGEDIRRVEVPELIAAYEALQEGE